MIESFSPTFFGSKAQTTSEWAAYNPVASPRSWFEVSLKGFADENAGEYVSFGDTFSSPSVKIGENPRVRFILSMPGKVDEQYLGSFQTEDGRTLIIKEYTIAFDIGAYTDEDALSYFNNPPYIGHELELFALEWWDLKPPEGTFRDKDFIMDAAANPTKYYDENDPAYHQRLNETFTVYGYWDSARTAEQKFQEIGNRQTTGALDVEIRVKASSWQDVFKPILTDTGNFTYSNEIYTRILDVRCANSESGFLKLGKQYSIFQDARNLDSSSTENPLADSSVPPSRSETFCASDHTSGDETATDDTTSTYTVYGEYLESESGYLPPRITGHEASGNAENQKMKIWEEGGRSISSQNLGYDPTQPNIDTAYFSAFFSLKPETKLDLYRHSWHYMYEGVGARTTYELNPIWIRWLSYFKSYGKVWSNYGGSISTIKSKDVVTGFHLRNVFVISTFYVRVQVGAYYEWEPPEIVEDWKDGFGDLGQNEGDDSFPPIVEGTLEGEAEKTFEDIFFGWALNLAAYLFSFALAGLVVVAMWLYWVYQAYDKSRRPRSGHEDAAMGPPWMAAIQQQQQRGEGRGFFNYLLENLGKKIIGSIIVFIVMTIVFSIFL